MTRKTLNVGCGDRIYKEYPKGFPCTNIDNRPDLDEVDVVGDVRDLSMFKEAEFSYILASDIIEHFPLEETESIIKEWHRVLDRQGTLEIRTPNLKWAAFYYSHTGDAKFVSWHIFGGQDYEGNCHYVMFDRAWLRSICEPVGFKELDYEEDHSNFIMKLQKI